MNNPTISEITDSITGEVFTTVTIQNEDGGFTSMSKIEFDKRTSNK